MAVHDLVVRLCRCARAVGPMALAALAASGGPVGCADGDGSIALVFPNEVARAAIRRLRVEAYSPDSGGTGLSDRSCRDFLGRARLGIDPLGTPVRGDYQCAEPCGDGWFTTEELPRVPAGRQILYVLAYASNAPGGMPILEGCTDRFDSTEEAGRFEDVQVVLDFVIPDNTRLVKVDGDRQVGRPSSTLGLPLTVEVRASAPVGDDRYVIPGVPVAFASETDGYTVGDRGAGPVVVPAGSDGRASIGVGLSAIAGTGVIRARAAVLEGVRSAVDTVRFSVSVTETTRFPRTDVIRQPPGGRPVALAAGDFDQTGGLDLATVTCSGTAEQCVLTESIPNPGPATMSVIANVASPDRALLPVRGELGVLPVDLRAVDLLPPRRVQEIALLNARRSDCQDRTCATDRPCACFGLAVGAPCPCEGSEIRVLRVADTAVELTGSYTLTASNGVGLGVLPGYSSGGYDGLVVAARGRMRNDRPCSRANTCALPNVSIDAERALCQQNPEVCGCPPNEFCECSDCANDSGIGFCTANDKMLDFLILDDPATESVLNEGGCQQWVATCTGEPTRMSTCACLDMERRGRCSGTDGVDGCGCRIPVASRLGGISAPLEPLGVAVGPLRPGSFDEVVVPSSDGLGLVQRTQLSNRAPFSYRGTPTTNAPIHRAVVVRLDDALEPGPASPADVVWIARGECTRGFDRACPQIDANEGDAPRIGCMGVYYTDGQASIFALKPPLEGGCRRHALTFLPDGLCVGRFNEDEHVDVAVAAVGVPEVMVFSGDGRGGLLDPPERFSLPDAGGGPLACGDFDGDRRDDIAVFSTNPDGRATGVVLLRTRP